MLIENGMYIGYTATKDCIIKLKIDPNISNNMYDLNRMGIVNKYRAQYRCKEAIIAEIRDKFTGEVKDSVIIFSSSNPYYLGNTIKSIDSDNPYSHGILYFLEKNTAFSYLTSIPYEASSHNIVSIRYDTNGDFTSFSAKVLDIGIIYEYNDRKNFSNIEEEFSGASYHTMTNRSLNSGKGFDFSYINGEASYRIFNKEGEQIHSFYTIDNKLEGSFKSKSNGKIYDVEFKNNVLNGSYKIWYDNGKPESNFYFINGELDGLCEIWHNNGTLKAKFTCINGNLHGLYESWNENGLCLLSCNYENGNLFGKYEAWQINNENGEHIPYISCTCIDGRNYFYTKNPRIPCPNANSLLIDSCKLDFTYSLLHQNGNILSKIEYVKGNVKKHTIQSNDGKFYRFSHKLKGKKYVSSENNVDDSDNDNGITNMDSTDNNQGILYNFLCTDECCNVDKEWFIGYIPGKTNISIIKIHHSDIILPFTPCLKETIFKCRKAQVVRIYNKYTNNDCKSPYLGTTITSNMDDIIWCNSWEWHKSYLMEYICGTDYIQFYNGTTYGDFNIFEEDLSKWSKHPVFNFGTGMYRTRHKNGNVASRANVINGFVIDKYETFHESGNIKQSTEFIQENVEWMCDEANGNTTLFYDNGNIYKTYSKKLYYENGIHIYYSNGQLRNSIDDKELYHETGFDFNKFNFDGSTKELIVN